MANQLFTFISAYKPAVSTRASFCCTKKIEKNAYVYNESCKKLHLFTNIKNDSDLLQQFICI